MRQGDHERTINPHKMLASMTCAGLGWSTNDDLVDEKVVIEQLSG